MQARLSRPINQDEVDARKKIAHRNKKIADSFSKENWNPRKAEKFIIYASLALENYSILADNFIARKDSQNALIFLQKTLNMHDLIYEFFGQYAKIEDQEISEWGLCAEKLAKIYDEAGSNVKASGYFIKALNIYERLENQELKNAETSRVRDVLAKMPVPVFNKKDKNSTPRDLKYLGSHLEDPENVKNNTNYSIFRIVQEMNEESRKREQKANEEKANEENANCSTSHMLKEMNEKHQPVGSISTPQLRLDEGELLQSLPQLGSEWEGLFEPRPRSPRELREKESSFFSFVPWNLSPIQEINTPPPSPRFSETGKQSGSPAPSVVEEKSGYSQECSKADSLSGSDDISPLNTPSKPIDIPLPKKDKGPLWGRALPWTWMRMTQSKPPGEPAVDAVRSQKSKILMNMR
ncbi:MAG TPA: DUF3736 domain-containing protein [Gammaproteobacteria bacterium]|nr:DUF3736 domain-containing protein [Gammaproteobacteria bacterium]